MKHVVHLHMTLIEIIVATPRHEIHVCDLLSLIVGQNCFDDIHF